MKIGIAGSSGFIGTALRAFLKAAGEEIKLLKRGIDYNPDTLLFRKESFQDLDAIINLAGINIFGLWTEKKKEHIKQSRVHAAQALNHAAHGASIKVFINASAIGFYGNRGDEVLTEDSAPGKGFLAEVVQDWEKAVPQNQMRVADVRFGMVLNHKGGALAKMLPIFKLGLGGKIGSGKQWMSWIALEDVLGVIYHVINTPTLSGPVNVVSPHPLRNADFTKILGQMLNRPTFCTVPEFAIKLLLGEMGEELLLSSQRVIPKKLIETKYPFLYPEIQNLKL